MGWKWYYLSLAAQMLPAQLAKLLAREKGDVMWWLERLSESSPASSTNDGRVSNGSLVVSRCGRACVSSVACGLWQRFGGVSGEQVAFPSAA